MLFKVIELKGIQETEFFFNGKIAYGMRLKKNFLEMVIICKFSWIWTVERKPKTYYRQ